MSHVFLVGFMGAGKSTVGKRLASLLERPFIDLDDMIAAQRGREIAQIFAEQGESVFRAFERDALAVLAGRPASVVACGGGIVTLAESRTLLHEMGTVVYLRTTVAESLARISDTSSRPLLAGPDGEARAEALLGERSALYEASADIEIDTVGVGPQAVAQRIAEALKERQSAR